jgi:hypothetical protein
MDSTGLKVYGEGEGKVRKQGWSKHRTWRKLHLAINEETQEIEACVATEAQGSRGGMSPSSRHVRTSEFWKQERPKIQKQLQSIYRNPRLTDEEKAEQATDLLSKFSPTLIQQSFEEAKRTKNPFAAIVASGLKGKPDNVNNLISAPLLFGDSSGKVVPIPVLRGYGAGLRPMEYWASSYGTRKGLVDVKLGTGEAGFLCLAEGTLVRMANFSVKKIEEIQVGDVVLGVDESLRGVPVDVVHIFDNGGKECWRTRFTLGAERDTAIFLESTLDHKVYGKAGQYADIAGAYPIGTEGGFAALVFKPASYSEGEDQRRYDRQEQTFLGEKKTYDIEVDSSNHLFVLANGLIVSNSKQIATIMNRAVVVGEDDEDETPELRGLPVDVSDDDSIGSLLASRVGEFPRNTVVTASVLRKIRKLGVKRILLRSPLVGGSQNGGLYAKDAGIREYGRLPVLGENVGMSAGAAMAEPISQAKLCLDENTLIRMADLSLRRINSLVAGEWILGATDDLETVPVAVKAVYCNGVQNCYRAVFRADGCGDDYEVIGTSDHKLYGAVCNATLNEDGLETIPDQFESIPMTAKCRFFYLAPLRDPAFLGVCHPERASRPLLQRRRLEEAGLRNTYNLEVDSPNHLFVLGNGILSNNSSKHTAGIVASSRKAIAGFDAINQMIQTPKENVHWATHATEDGVVTAISEAPQGGKYVQISGGNHYVPAGREVLVKRGETIEAGDMIGSGLPNPAVVVKYKGIGEGRKYFTEKFTQLMRDSGVSVNRRNVELLGRGLVNHVELTDEMEDYVPGDVVPYNMFEKYYTPRETARSVRTAEAAGKYLERPVLHYTIGTKVRPSVIRDLQEFGIEYATVHDDPPNFQPVMVRGMAIAASDPDPVTSMQGSGIKRRLLEAVHRAHVSNPKGTSYTSGLVFDRNFAQEGSGSVVQSPVDQLDQMREKRRKAPVNPFEMDDDD